MPPKNIRSKAKTPNQPSFADGALLLSSVRKALGESKSNIECLEKVEAYLSLYLPETIDLCESPQEGAFALKLPSKRNTATNTEVPETTERAVSPMVKANTLDEACSSRSICASPTATRLMFWGGDSTEECNATAFQALKDIATAMTGIKQLMHINIEIIELTAKKSEKLRALIQEKNEENHELLSLMIDRHAMVAEDGSVSMSNEARREIVGMHARMMEAEGA